MPQRGKHYLKWYKLPILFPFFILQSPIFKLKTTRFGTHVTLKLLLSLNPGFYLNCDIFMILFLSFVIYLYFDTVLASIIQ